LTEDLFFAGGETYILLTIMGYIFLFIFWGIIGVIIGLVKGKSEK